MSNLSNCVAHRRNSAIQYLSGNTSSKIRHRFVVRNLATNLLPSGVECLSIGVTNPMPYVHLCQFYEEFTQTVLHFSRERMPTIILKPTVPYNRGMLSHGDRVHNQ